MTKFLTGSNLDNEIESIIRDAKKKLLLISPYINLNDSIRSLLLQKTTQPELEIIIAFREELKEWDYTHNTSKDEPKLESVYKNLKEIEIWKSLPNVRLIGVKNLHAKYYANESKGVITSLNLYRYSIKHNIEYGCLVRGSVYTETTNYSEHILEDWGEVVYVKVPRFQVERGSKKYIDSVEVCNYITDNHSDKSKLSVRELSVEIGKTREIDNRSYTIEQKRQINKNAYKPWNKSSDTELLRLLEKGKSIDEISRIFERSPEAIKSRLKKLA